MRLFRVQNIPSPSEQGPVRNLRVTEETPNSFRVSWQAAPGAVIRYRLSYVQLNGAPEILEAQTIGSETSIVLQELFPITTYRVSVFAEYSTGMGEEMQIDGTTKEGQSSKLGIYRQVENGGSDLFLFTFSLRFASWPSRVWRDHIYNESGVAGRSRKCPAVPHCLQTCRRWREERGIRQGRDHPGCAEEPTSGHWIRALC